MNLDEFKDHTIKEVRPNQFCCSRPGGGTSWRNRFFVSEIGVPGQTPEGVVIAGDTRPCRNGVISDHGYSILWFSGDLSRVYLCEKFLHKEWQPEAAILWMRHWLDTGGDEDWSRDREEEIQREIHSAISYTADDFHGWYTGLFGDEPDGIGYDYNRHDADILVAIHATFRRLYHSRQQHGAYSRKD